MAYFDEGMPLPDPDRDTEKFWEATKEHRLLVQRCNGCGDYRFPPQPVCSACQSFDSTWEESRGAGKIFTYTIVHHPVHPATMSKAPFNVVNVKLDDCGGVNMTGNVLDAPTEAIKVGAKVSLVWADVADDLSLPLWKLAPGS